MRVFSRVFGKPKIEKQVDFSLVKTDVHSHLIPGIDDGAPNMEESLRLVRGIVELGYKKIITTPHVMSDLYPNSHEVILSGLADLQAAVREANIDVTIEAAAEYHIDQGFEELMTKGKLLTFGDNYVLVELSFVEMPPNMKRVIFELQLQGYKPVLAHPERYTYLHDSMEKIHAFKERGIVLQMNINSLTGQYGPEVKRFSERLVSGGYIRMIGSDCHHGGHINLMHQAGKHPLLVELVESGALLNTTL